MLRQLDQRNSAGLTITLEWDSDTDQVLVRCEDEHTGDQPLLCYPVEPTEARFAFLHPFTASPLRESESWRRGLVAGRATSDRSRGR
jgi:hypothetical protein